VLIATVNLRRLDSDADGDFDADDLDRFLDCMQGPDVLLEAPCAPTDNDQDVDGDLRDFVLVQRQFAGS
jgi:hypothetical protein